MGNRDNNKDRRSPQFVYGGSDDLRRLGAFFPEEGGEKPKEIPLEDFNRLSLLPDPPPQPCRLWARVVSQKLGNRSAVAYKIPKAKNNLGILPTHWRNLDQEEGLLVDIFQPKRLLGSGTVVVQCIPISIGANYSKFGMVAYVTKEGKLENYRENAFTMVGDTMIPAPFKTTEVSLSKEFDDSIHLRMVHALMLNLGREDKAEVLKTGSPELDIIR